MDEFPYWMRVMRYLNRYDAVIKTHIAKELDVTYSHVVKLLSQMKKDGKVSFRSDGRTMVVSLTPKGREEAEDVDRIMTRRNIPVVVQRGVR